MAAMDTIHTRKPCSSVQHSRASELERALALLRGGADPADAIEILSQRLTKRLLHLPTKLISEEI